MEAVKIIEKITIWLAFISFDGGGDGWMDSRVVIIHPLRVAGACGCMKQACSKGDLIRQLAVSIGHLAFLQAQAQEG